MKKELMGKVRLAAASLALGLALAPAAAAQPQQQKPPAQTPAGAQGGAPAPAKPSFTVKVSKAGPTPVINIKAKNAKLSEVTAELARQLEAPFKLSPVMARQSLNLEISDVNLEAALRMMAPHPLVDYEADGGGVQPPKVLAVYLYALNEQQPPLTDTVKSNSESLLIEGDTEEGTEEYERRKKEDPLQVSFANNRLSVRAEKQPLAVVLARVASELGIPFDASGGDLSETVDVNFQNYMFDQAMRALSPSVRFFYRSDLGAYETYPIRLTLVDGQRRASSEKQ